MELSLSTQCGRYHKSAGLHTVDFSEWVTFLVFASFVHPPKSANVHAPFEAIISALSIYTNRLNPLSRILASLNC